MVVWHKQPKSTCSVRRMLAGAASLATVVSSSLLFVPARATQAAPSQGGVAVVSDQGTVDPGKIRPLNPGEGQGSRESVQQPGGAVKKEPWATVAFGGRRLTNNVWGTATGEILTSQIYLQSDGTFGWDWNRSQPQMKPGQKVIAPIYPNVRIGGSPWEASPVRVFPIRLKDIASARFNISYSYPQPPIGRFNLAYDIFFTETPNTSPNPHPPAEVMIWVNGTTTQPPDRYQGQFRDGTNTFKLYSWVMSNGRQYYSFVLQNPPGLNATQTIDARKLLSSIPLNPNWYIHGVEFGDEIWNGSGKIAIRDFRINLNGVEL